eukprot:2156854-Rhodomonas_salina.1
MEGFCQKGPSSLPLLMRCCCRKRVHVRSLGADAPAGQADMRSRGPIGRNLCDRMYNKIASSVNRRKSSIILSAPAKTSSGNPGPNHNPDEHRADMDPGGAGSLQIASVEYNDLALNLRESPARPLPVMSDAQARDALRVDSSGAAVRPREAQPTYSDLPPTVPWSHFPAPPRSHVDAGSSLTHGIGATSNLGYVEQYRHAPPRRLPPSKGVPARAEGEKSVLEPPRPSGVTGRELQSGDEPLSLRALKQEMHGMREEMLGEVRRAEASMKEDAAQIRLSIVQLKALMVACLRRLPDPEGAQPSHAHGGPLGNGVMFERRRSSSLQDADLDVEMSMPVLQHPPPLNAVTTA